jgi:hypothetical protein
MRQEKKGINIETNKKGNDGNGIGHWSILFFSASYLPVSKTFKTRKSDPALFDSSRARLRQDGNRSFDCREGFCCVLRFSEGRCKGRGSQDGRKKALEDSKEEKGVRACSEDWASKKRCLARLVGVGEARSDEKWRENRRSNPLKVNILGRRRLNLKRKKEE